MVADAGRSCGEADGSGAGLSHRDGAGLSDPVWRDQTRATTTGDRVGFELGGAGGDLAGSGGRSVVAGDRRRRWDGRRRRSAERSPHNGGRRRYRAARADQQAWSRATRPKPCKLAGNPALRAIVAEKLTRRWSPQQIAGWLKTTYPTTSGDAGVARDDLPHPVHPVPRRAAQGADPVSAHRSGDPTPQRVSGCPTVVAAGPGPSTSPNGQPRPTTGRCPGTGRATWSSANA